MNPLALLGWWKEILIALLLMGLGAQTYRLQGTRAEYSLYRTEQELQEREREAEYARKVAFDGYNKRRTDEEHRDALRRAAAVRVRIDPAAPEAVPATPSAGSGDEEVVCFRRRILNEEVAGYERRLAERLEGIARAGESLAADYRACRGWALGVGSGPLGTGSSSHEDR